MGALCKLCPLRGSTPVLGRGKVDAKVAIVGEAPGLEEVRNDMPFIGKSGQLLDAWLVKVGAPRSTVWVDNAIACFPPGGDLEAYLKRAKKESKDFHHPVDCCRPRLFRALRVPKCAKCKRWVSGPERSFDAPILCTCAVPAPVQWSDGPPIDYVGATGNTALEALVGVHGITSWRGSPLNMERRRLRAAGLYKEAWERK